MNWQQCSLFDQFEKSIDSEYSFAGLIKSYLSYVILIGYNIIMIKLPVKLPFVLQRLSMCNLYLYLKVI